MRLRSLSPLAFQVLDQCAALSQTLVEIDHLDIVPFNASVGFMSSFASGVLADSNLGSWMRS